MGDEILTPMQYTGSTNAELFETWFEQVLLPCLPEDTVIVMDNASFHRKKQLFEIVDRSGFTLIFLPPYSPELNPIEKFWAWLKKTSLLLLIFSLPLMTLSLPLFKVGYYISV